MLKKQSLEELKRQGLVKPRMIRTRRQKRAAKQVFSEDTAPAPFFAEPGEQLTTEGVAPFFKEEAEKELAPLPTSTVEAPPSIVRHNQRKSQKARLSEIGRKEPKPRRKPIKA